MIGLVGISLGFQWTLLQSVAWTVMLLDRSTQMDWVQAIETTFDGHHPCALCKVVRQGRDNQQQQTTFVLSFAKTDMVPSDGAFKLALPEKAFAEHSPARDQRALSRSGSPPWQPPRHA